MSELITGDSRPYVAALTINGAPFEIPTTSGVRAALVSVDKKKIYIPAVTVSRNSAGSDWAASTIVFKFTREQTAAVAVPDNTEALVEVQVELPDGSGTSDWSWWLPITIRKGTI